MLEDNPDLKNQLDVIRDTFTDAPDYVMFMRFVELLNNQASNGDTAADQCLDIVKKFHRFIMISKKT